MVIVATGDDNIPAPRPEQRSERRPPIGCLQALKGISADGVLPRYGRRAGVDPTTNTSCALRQPDELHNSLSSPRCTRHVISSHPPPVFLFCHSPSCSSCT